MNKILEINEDDFDCFVEAGITRKRLNETIRDSGLFFCVDPGTDASIGGMIATCASGTTSLRYGTIKTNVKNLEVVLPDGLILNTRGKHAHPSKSSAGLNLTELFVGNEGILGIITSACLKLHIRPMNVRKHAHPSKSSAGLNLTELFVGYEGILGIITSACLKLHIRPMNVSAAICGFPDIKDAINAVISIRKLGISIARIEFLDSEQIKACNKFNKKANEIQFEEKPTLILEFHGSSERDIEEQSTATEEICLFNHGQQFKWSKSKTDIHNLWAARHNAYYAIVKSNVGEKGFSTDICVPISKLYSVILETQKDLKELGLHSPILGPIAEGGFHCFFSVNPENFEEMERISKFSDRLVKRALEAGGTCSGEHGIGIGKKKYLKKELGPSGYKLLQTFKKTLDPNIIMNPGKVIDI
uniref:FAD-binding PCMH-type domain-containing protein n=1 Tax=Panagrolaimus sp. PS1159 TaxID=55785 RepID=A0AC35GN89_9BILA